MTLIANAGEAVPGFFCIGFIVVMGGVAIYTGVKASRWRKSLRRYLTCGLLCFGFARAKCTSCGHGFLVAFSCKGRGVCPSCTGRRMAQTAAHLAYHVIPPVPMRQWVISVPKRLRGILADRPQAVTTLSRIFLEEIERLLCHAADLPTDRDAAGQARPRLGAVSFQHRFGSALNQHVHLHACVTDGVYERMGLALNDYPI